MLPRVRVMAQAGNGAQSLEFRIPHPGGLLLEGSSQSIPFLVEIVKEEEDLHGDICSKESAPSLRDGKSQAELALELC